MNVVKWLFEAGVNEGTTQLELQRAFFCTRAPSILLGQFFFNDWDAVELGHYFAAGRIIESNATIVASGGDLLSACIEA